VAWQFPNDRLDDAFDFMFREDPFSGHVVIRSTDAATPGSSYRLWTTVKVPQGYSVEKHCAVLARLTGAERFRVMPAKRIFALGVGHVRRKGMEAGQQVGRARGRERHGEGRALGSRVAGADGAQARARAGGSDARSMGASRSARPACRWRRFSKRRRVSTAAA
jgi:hypothetical protein